jgi:hypothetical protein
MPALLQAYSPRVVATLLLGRPQLLERLLEDATCSSPSAQHVPSPAVLASIALQQGPVQLDARVGDCTPCEPPPLPNRPSSRLLRAMERGGWTDPQDGGADDFGDDAEDADEQRPAARSPPRRAPLRAHPRGSPPPRDAGAKGGSKKRAGGRR